MDFNKVILIGRLTHDPQLKQTPNGVSVTSFAIAVNRPQTNGAQAVADFINIVAWRGTAEFVTKYFSKGKRILVVGKLQIRSWTDNQNVKRTTAEVVADEVSFVDSKTTGNSDTPPTPLISSENCADTAEYDEDLPF